MENTSQRENNNERLIDFSVVARQMKIVRCEDEIDFDIWTSEQHRDGPFAPPIFFFLQIYCLD